MSEAGPSSSPPTLSTPNARDARSVTSSRRRRSHRRIALTWIAILAGIYALWCAVLYHRQTDLIFPRAHTRRVLSSEKIPKYVQHWWLEIAGDSSSSGEKIRVEAYFVPAVTTALPATAPLIVYFHGNGDSLDRCLDSVQFWRAKGYNVLVPEYRGYGRSGGTPSEGVIVADSTLFLNRALAQPTVDPARVLFHGRSLGTGVAAQVCRTFKPRALIVESGFTSVASFAAGYGVPSWLLKSTFRTDLALRTLTDPPATLILHSPEDTIVPYVHGQRLHAAIKGSKFFAFNGSHLDAIEDKPEVLERIDAFLIETGIQSPEAEPAPLGTPAPSQTAPAASPN